MGFFSHSQLSETLSTRTVQRKTSIIGNFAPLWVSERDTLRSVQSRFAICIGNHMGLSAIWRKKLHGNRQVIARGEAECNSGLLCVQFF